MLLGSSERSKPHPYKQYGTKHDYRNFLLTATVVPSWDITLKALAHSESDYPLLSRVGKNKIESILNLSHLLKITKQTYF